MNETNVAGAGTNGGTPPSTAVDNPAGNPATGNGHTAEGAPATGPEGGAAPESARKPIGARRPHYMLSPHQAPGLQPLDADVVAQQLRSSPDITVVKTIQAPRPKLLGLMSFDEPPLGALVVAKMTPEKAHLLQTKAGAKLTVERDYPLRYARDLSVPESRLPNPGILVPHAQGFTVTLEVVGASGPLAGADVFVYGSIWPTQGITDASGRVTLNLLGEDPGTIDAIYVKPKLDHWSIWIDRPALEPGGTHQLTVKPLSAQLSGFPGQQLLGWGQRAMGLDRVPASFDGRGIKIAVIDSGAAQSHRNLGRVGPGVSVVGNDPNAWTSDLIGHGSHCAGIIGGGPVGPQGGVRGFAPAAEIHVCRIFPGGRFSDLVAAIDYAIENEIDVVNMSLGGGEPSKIIEERLVRAKELGIACIAAAGNSAGPVQFPASTPHVLAVAAMGKWGEFPEDSYHARQALEGVRDGDYFPAAFSCFGPEVDVCAPGVAVVSSLPDDGFGAWDGTSMAAPHVTGLAALVLAHHPDFAGPYQARDARRVERLFQILEESAAPLAFGDPHRAGAGMPYAPRALGLEEAASTTSAPAMTAEQVPHAMRELLDALLGQAPAGRAEPFALASAPPPPPRARPRETAAMPPFEKVARGPVQLHVDRPTDSLRAALREAGLMR